MWNLLAQSEQKAAEGAKQRCNDLHDTRWEEHKNYSEANYSALMLCLLVP